MKKAVIALVVCLALVGGLITILSLESVGQGEVGVVWTMKNGVQEEVLTPGIHFISPTAKMKTYPISQQQLVLSNNPAHHGEASHQHWSIYAPADCGLVHINMTVDYTFIADRVLSLSTSFTWMDTEAIEDGT